MRYSQGVMVHYAIAGLQAEFSVELAGVVGANLDQHLDGGGRGGGMGRESVELKVVGLG